MIRLRSFTASARQVRLRAGHVGSGFSRILATAVLFAISATSSALACPQCFGAEETTLVGGTKLGVLVMLAVTLVVQGGFVAFFLYHRKRAKRFADVEFDNDWA